ncbi:LLM class flavin-dependent oxidoreductase [Streptomyces sp. AV19]|uniref:LLM class flavin-dependent oxidoreductase n=1 Tax=Streptomyces sp. AV19 TaxID=2793068 RepID=UPI0018FEF7C3|nr:LLM class flavin-dependent oxidoreductase [Streptomyces sp. AV19]MBH1936576.1 LLM class flavin-dependent oxidoreductase [Streptomyces sp. AV19]MDG4532635.1 LLM class flavin-dependent oxidoreductase [Streptomyces sp. AV19]
MPVPIRPLHLAVALDRSGTHEAESCVRAVRLAERGRFDFVTLGGGGGGGGDALGVLARVAPATERIGLVAAVAITRAEPFRVSCAVAALDRVSRGRAGWTAGPAVPAAGEEAWREADAVADGVARVWDGREDGAGFHDAADGPSAVPPPPQGHPVTVVDATAPAARDTAARHADVVLLRAERAHDPAVFRAGADELREAAHVRGAGGRRLVVLASVPVALHAAVDAVALADQVGLWYTSGAADGFHFRPEDPERDLPLLVDGTAAVLQHRGLLRRFYPGATLREHLGLPRPVGRGAPA